METDLKFAICAAFSPKAKMETVNSIQPNSNTIRGMGKNGKGRDKRNPTKEYVPIARVKIIKFGKTREMILSHPSKKFFLRKNPIMFYNVV